LALMRVLFLKCILMVKSLILLFALLSSAPALAQRIEVCVPPQYEDAGGQPDSTRYIISYGWFHRDALVNTQSAHVRVVIIRQINGLPETRYDEIRAAYKEGQKHNADAYALIDDCDDQTVLDMSYKAAEEIRLKTCERPPPARSATCIDLRNNIIFAIRDASSCSIFARAYINKGISDSTLLLWNQARKIRIGLKIAQGHRQEIFDSFDYIGDELLLTMAKSLFEVERAGEMRSGFPRASDESHKRVCPGWAKVLDPE
jgi:hypothetical protein